MVSLRLVFCVAAVASGGLFVSSMVKKLHKEAGTPHWTHVGVLSDNTELDSVQETPDTKSKMLLDSLSINLTNATSHTAHMEESSFHSISRNVDEGLDVTARPPAPPAPPPPPPAAHLPHISPCFESNRQSRAKLGKKYALPKVGSVNYKVCKGHSVYSSGGELIFKGKDDAEKVQAEVQVALQVAVLFRGDSFRLRSERSKYVGHKELQATMQKRLMKQDIASASHAKFLFEDLRKAGFCVDIYIHTFLTPDCREECASFLMKAYEPWGSVTASFPEKKPLNQGDGFLQAVDFIKKHVGQKKAAELPYDYIFVMRLDIVLISSVVPPMTVIASQIILYPMRDCKSCWGEFRFVQDAIFLIPELYFTHFFDKTLGTAGCFFNITGSASWFDSSGHGCFFTIDQRMPEVNQGFWYDGCYRVRDTHPLYFLTGSAGKIPWQCVGMVDKQAQQQCKRDMNQAADKPFQSQVVQ